MKIKIILLFIPVLLLLKVSCFAQANIKTTVIPLAGNTFFSNYAESGVELSETGIVNWIDPSVSATIYVRFLEKGLYKMAFKAKSASKATINVRISNQSKNFKVKKGDWQIYPIGQFEISDTGYVALVLKGLNKGGANFGDIQSLEIEGDPSKFQYVKDDFYFGRRGPSVHLSYEMPSNKNFEWFYNEVTVPKGRDEIGSYFMANGFKEGYFGIQVNSATERRVLFSIWSPFSTDDPKSIPDSLKIVLLKKGKNVYAGEFGNEGSGGQSYLRFNWKADVTYKFLTHIKPNSDSSTVFTAYFFDTETDKWLLVASFKRPKTHTWLTQPHSFLENFEPERGALIRKGFYNNQWVCDTAPSRNPREGEWTELTKAKFTNDATARKKARMDFTGGVENNQFFLSNCGFFSQYTVLNTLFERQATGKKPIIDFKKLPKE